MPTPPLLAAVPTTLRDRRQPERGRKAIFAGAEAAAVGSHVSARGRQQRAEPGSPATAGGLGACEAGGGRGRGRGRGRDGVWSRRSPCGWHPRGRRLWGAGLGGREPGGGAPAGAVIAVRVAGGQRGANSGEQSKCWAGILNRCRVLEQSESLSGAEPRLPSPVYFRRLMKRFPK